MIHLEDDYGMSALVPKFKYITSEPVDEGYLISIKVEEEVITLFYKDKESVDLLFLRMMNE